MNTLQHCITRIIMSRPRLILLSAWRGLTLQQLLLPALATLFSISLGGCGSSNGDSPLPVAPAVAAPTITQQPASATVAQGASASFTVAANGSAPLSFQWTRGGATIAGATSATYTLPAATMADSGAVFRVTVSNSAGSATSNDAGLTVSNNATVNFQSQTCALGSGSVQTWCYVHALPHGVGYSAVRFADDNTVVTISTGELPFVHRSSDGGVTWQHNRSSFSDYTTVSFGSPTQAIFTGQVGGSKLTSTSDDTGDVITSRSVIAGGNAIAHASAAVAVVLADDGFHRTADGGLTWTPATPLPDAGLAVKFVDAATGVIVGDNGSIFRSIDAGATWATITSPTSAELHGVDFRQQIGIAVGENGAIVRSGDGGATWVAIASGSTANLQAVRFSSDSVIVAIGDAVLRSTDAGLTWSAVPVAAFDTLKSIDFRGNLGLMVGAELWRTTDAGATWTKGGGHTRFNELAFSDASNGIAVGDGLTTAPAISTTADGGATWTARTVPASVTEVLESAAMPTATLAFAGGTDTLLRSTDGGQTWAPAPVAIPSGGSVLGIAFADANTGLFVGGHAGNVLRTTDGGATYNVVNTGLPGSAFLRGVAVNGTTAVAVGANSIVRSTDSGATWSIVPAPSAPFKYVAFVSSTVVLAAANNGNSNSLYRSVDAGLTWTQVALPAFNGSLGRIAVASPTSVVVMRGSRPFVSTDGGQTFNGPDLALGNFPLTTFNDIHFITPTTAIGAPAMGLLRTVNGP